MADIEMTAEERERLLFTLQEADGYCVECEWGGWRGHANSIADAIQAAVAPYERALAEVTAEWDRLREVGDRLAYVIERTPLFRREGYDASDVEAYIHEWRTAAMEQQEERG